MSYKPEISYYSVAPRVVKSGIPSRITISPLFEHVQLSPQSTYEIYCTPMEDIGNHSSFKRRHKPTWRLVNGAIELTHLFEGEQEHSLLLEEVRNNDRAPLADFRVYSVDDDLFSLKPYKGDMHMHSNRSDGRESPGYVAASCRKIGMDFMALTDHRQYEPSVESQRAFKDAEIDLQIFRGEEVHPPDNPIHIINFGGAASINRLFEDSSYRSEVKRIENAFADLPDNLDSYYYASSLWCFDKIRQLGGLGIFCHPYWVSHERYHIPGSLTDRMFIDQPFDAYELIGGYQMHEVESNMLQVLRYQEETANGRRIPIVGVSDAHGCDRGDLFGWYFTIIFSASLELQDIFSSIKNLYSVAVEHIPGIIPRAHGPMRLAKYAQFLLREVFPGHDALCHEEGLEMYRYLAGHESSGTRLAELKGRVEAYLELCYGGTAD